MKKFLLSSCVALSAMTMYADSWTKVTNASDITFDGQYLIVCESKNVVMGAEIGTAKYLPKVDTQAISNNSITTDGSEAFAMVTFEGTDFNACQVKISTLDGTAKGYYKTTAAKSMSLDATSGTNAAVTLTSGNISINFGNTPGILYYNANSPRFLNYTSKQTEIQLYKKEVGGDTDTKTALTLSFPEKSYSVNIGEQFTAPELSSDPVEAINNISLTYSSSNESVATVDNNGNVDIKSAGTTDIKVSFAGDEVYKAASTSYTLTVVDPNKLSEAIVFANKNYSNAQEISIIEQGVVSLKFAKEDGSNNPAYYDAKKDVRLYAKGSLTISVKSGYVITEIISTYNNTTNALTANSGTFNSDYTVWTATDKVNTVTFKEGGTKGNRSWTAIEVHYTKAGDASKDDVILTFESEVMNVEFEEGKQVQGLVASTNGVEGLTFSYSSSDENVATVDNNGMLTLVGIGSTTITAKTEATDEYNEGMASYTLSVERAYHNFNEIIASATEGEKIDVKFPMTVGYVNGANIFATDNQGGYMLLFMYDNEYAAGDIIPAGMTASYTIYNGLPELKPSTAPAATEKGEYVIETVEAAEIMSQPLNKIVRVMDVNFAAATPAGKSNFTGTASGLELAFRNGMGLASVEAGTYDVTMVIGTYTLNATTVQAPNQLQPIEYVAVPTAPVVMIDGEAVDTDAAFELQGKEVVVYLTAQEGASIWYKFTAANADNSEVAPLAEDGFTEYTAEGITIGEKLGTLEYYSELNGRKSAISSLTFQGTPTAINEIEAEEGAATEWFDLSGRRVAAPSKGGIYVKKTGSKVSKYAF